jgi:Cu(I)-responsive transcriptional regulator
MNEINIGEAAKRGGVSAKMIRHYESIGLINAAKRTDSGYRLYSQNDVHMLRFIRQARNLGFSIVQIKELLSLWKNQRRTSRRVKELATSHINELDERIRELQAIKHTLEHLAQHCHGDDRPDCPILESLEQDSDKESTVSNMKEKNKFNHNFSDRRSD